MRLATAQRLRVEAGLSRYVFVAGGIGITPILPMLAEAERRGADWTLHYGGRTRARAWPSSRNFPGIAGKG